MWRREACGPFLGSTRHQQKISFGNYIICYPVPTNCTDIATDAKSCLCRWSWITYPLNTTFTHSATDCVFSNSTFRMPQCEVAPCWFAAPNSNRVIGASIVDAPYYYSSHPTLSGRTPTSSRRNGVLLVTVYTLSSDLGAQVGRNEGTGASLNVGHIPWLR